MKKSNKETIISKCNDGIIQSFSGSIVKIDRYEYDEFMSKSFFTLKIKTTDTSNTYIDYQFHLEHYKNILNFTKPGQKVLKEKGKDTFIVFTDNTHKRTFTIPDCKLRD